MQGPAMTAYIAVERIIVGLSGIPLWILASVWSQPVEI